MSDSRASTNALALAQLILDKLLASYKSKIDALPLNYGNLTAIKFPELLAEIKNVENGITNHKFFSTYKNQWEFYYFKIKFLIKQQRVDIFDINNVVSVDFKDFADEMKNALEQLARFEAGKYILQIQDELAQYIEEQAKILDCQEASQMACAIHISFNLLRLNTLLKDLYRKSLVSHNKEAEVKIINASTVLFSKMQVEYKKAIDNALLQKDSNALMKLAKNKKDLQYVYLSGWVLFENTDLLAQFKNLIAEFNRVWIPSTNTILLYDGMLEKINEYLLTNKVDEASHLTKNLLVHSCVNFLMPRYSKYGFLANYYQGQIELKRGNINKAADCFSNATSVLKERYFYNGDLPHSLHDFYKKTIITNYLSGYQVAIMHLWEFAIHYAKNSEDFALLHVLTSLINENIKEHEMNYLYIFYSLKATYLLSDREISIKLGIENFQNFKNEINKEIVSYQAILIADNKNEVLDDNLGTYFSQLTMELNKIKYNTLYPQSAAVLYIVNIIKKIENHSDFITASVDRKYHLSLLKINFLLKFIPQNDLLYNDWLMHMCQSLQVLLEQDEQFFVIHLNKIIKESVQFVFDEKCYALAATNSLGLQKALYLLQIKTNMPAIDQEIELLQSIEKQATIKHKAEEELIEHHVLYNIQSNIKYACDRAEYQYLKQQQLSMAKQKCEAWLVKFNSIPTCYLINPTPQEIESYLLKDEFMILFVDRPCEFKIYYSPTYIYSKGCYSDPNYKNKKEAVENLFKNKAKKITDQEIVIFTVTELNSICPLGEHVFANLYTINLYLGLINLKQENYKEALSYFEQSIAYSESTIKICERFDLFSKLYPLLPKIEKIHAFRIFALYLNDKISEALNQLKYYRSNVGKTQIAEQYFNALITLFRQQEFEKKDAKFLSKLKVTGPIQDQTVMAHYNSWLEVIKINDSKNKNKLPSVSLNERKKKNSPEGKVERKLNQEVKEELKKLNMERKQKEKIDNAIKKQNQELENKIKNKINDENRKIKAFQDEIKNEKSLTEDAHSKAKEHTAHTKKLHNEIIKKDEELLSQINAQKDFANKHIENTRTKLSQIKDSKNTIDTRLKTEKEALAKIEEEINKEKLVLKNLQETYRKEKEKEEQEKLLQEQKNAEQEKSLIKVADNALKALPKEKVLTEKLYMLRNGARLFYLERFQGKIFNEAVIAFLLNLTAHSDLLKEASINLVGSTALFLLLRTWYPDHPKTSRILKMPVNDIDILIKLQDFAECSKIIELIKKLDHSFELKKTSANLYCNVIGKIGDLRIDITIANGVSYESTSSIPFANCQLQIHTPNESCQVDPFNRIYFMDNDYFFTVKVDPAFHDLMKLGWFMCALPNAQSTFWIRRLIKYKIKFAGILDFNPDQALVAESNLAQNGLVTGKEAIEHLEIYFMLLLLSKEYLNAYKELFSVMNEPVFFKDQNFNYIFDYIYKFFCALLKCREFKSDSQGIDQVAHVVTYFVKFYYKRMHFTQNNWNFTPEILKNDLNNILDFVVENYDMVIRETDFNRLFSHYFAFLQQKSLHQANIHDQYAKYYAEQFAFHNQMKQLHVHQANHYMNFFSTMNNKKQLKFASQNHPSKPHTPN